MMKNLLICLLATFNIVTYSFIGLNHEAYSALVHYPDIQSISTPDLDMMLQQFQQDLKIAKKKDRKKPLHISKKKVVEAEEEEQAFLVIPKLSLIVPVSFAGVSSEDQAQAKLTEGVISLASFTPPTQPGKNLIFGHSSDYPWNNNPYGTIFTLLHKLTKGDMIKIVQGKKSYSYLVDSTLVTDPESVSSLTGDESGHQLILSTCWPIGFFSQRFNVVATPATS